jgi:MSHA biogenesis protein MshG
MVKAGEASGKLDEVLLHLAELGEFDAEVKERLKSATRYPLITFITLIVAFCLVITLVLPKFAALYGQFTAKLPLPTRILLGIQHTIQYDWPQVIVALAAIFFAGRYALQTPFGRYQWDRMKLRMPVFGELYLNLLMSRFTRVLAELLASGIPILQALQLVSDTVGNEVIRRALVRIQESVNEGKGMAEPIKRSGLFSPMVYQMISVGEQSGKTDELLRYVADYYRSQATFMMKNLTTLIEPMLIFVIGGFVLVLALGVFLPLWDLMSVIKR